MAPEVACQVCRQVSVAQRLAAQEDLGVPVEWLVDPVHRVVESPAFLVEWEVLVRPAVLVVGLAPVALADLVEFRAGLDRVAVGSPLLRLVQQ